jgi:hypothetical protein
VVLEGVNLLNQIQETQTKKVIDDILAGRLDAAETAAREIPFGLIWAKEQLK